MFRCKSIIALIICLSVFMAGFPAFAAPPCPMQPMMASATGSDMEHCAKCPEMTKKPEHKKNRSCCDGMGCAVKCAGSITLAIFASDHPMPLPRIAAPVFADTDSLPISHRLHSQDRPPKHLA